MKVKLMCSFSFFSVININYSLAVYFLLFTLLGYHGGKRTTSPLLLAVQRQKEFLVKYKGLAHVHNRWIPEEKIKVENPELLAKYSLAKYKRYQV